MKIGEYDMIGRIISSFVGTILAITVLDLLNSANEEQEKQEEIKEKEIIKKPTKKKSKTAKEEK